MTRDRDQHEVDAHGRTEPTLGNLADLDVPAEDGDALPPISAGERVSRTPPPVPPRRRGWLLVLGLLLVAAVAVVWVNQNRLRGRVPRTELNDVLARAQQALQAGRRDGHAGTSARELYQAVIVVQPDNDAAHDGLQRTGRALLAQADAALQAGHVEQAAQAAAVARDLLGGGSDIDRLDRAILAARSPAPATPSLVEQAQQALAAGKLDGPQGAAALYQQIAHADPGSAVATHGLDQVGDAMARQAQQALDAHDATTAGARIEQLAALQPTNGALPALRAAQAQLQAATTAATAASVAAKSDATPPVAVASLPPPPAPIQAAPAVDQRAVDSEVRQGQAALRAGRISGAGSDTALAHFKAALRLDPDNAPARDGLGKIAQALTVQANAATDAGDSAQATRLLAQAAVLAPHSADLAAARAHLANSGRQSGPVADNADDATVPAAPIALSPQQSATIARLVQRAQAATQRGDIMMPPGDSAYDAYRSALAIDGNNAAALQGLHALPDAVAQQFQRALAAGNLHQAEDMLANYAELAPGGARHAGMTARLTSAWLDQAEQQLARGDRAGAAQALDRARRLAPGDSRLASLSARLAGS
jgi:tetratricopeptide (TPR) repeat protein